ncbi:MAG: hypothetical protein JXR83_19455, partial [Deltaproteobacteria bacterium]|nr:hypothetical protein [Deltaproteobacteria bacterium]
MRRLPALLTGMVTLGALACPPASGPEDGGASGSDELYLNDQLLSDLQVTALKGRCALRLTINAQTV